MISKWLYMGLAALVLVSLGISSSKDITADDIENEKPNLRAMNESDPAYWLVEGEALLNSGRYNESIAPFDKAIEIDSQYADAWNKKGIALFYGMLRYDESLECYDQAIKLDSSNPDYWYNKGNVLSYGLLRYEESLEYYDKAIALNSSNPIYWNFKGNVFHYLKRNDESLECYDKAISLNSSNPDYWFNKGNVLYAKGWANYGYALAGRAEYDEAIFNDAINAYDNAIKIDPKLVYAWNMKGTTLANQGKNDEAIDAFDEAIRINPHYASAWTGKGTALFMQGKYDAAIKAYDEAIKIDPTDEIALTNKGATLARVNGTDSRIQAESNLIDNDQAWFYSVCNTEEVMKDGDDEIDWIWEGDASQVVIELRQKVTKSLTASKGYEISPEYETIKDDYEAALALYIMNLDDLLDAIKTMNANGYVEGSRAMKKMVTAFAAMEYQRERVLDVCKEEPYSASQGQGNFITSISSMFPSFKTTEDVMKFFCLNNQALYRASSGGEITGLNLAEEILNNPNATLDLANEYGLTRYGGC